MATTVKVLGQVNPAADTNTTLYTVPASTSAVVSSFVISNVGTTLALVRLAVRPAGATLDPKHYVAYDVELPTRNSLTLTLGVTLATTDVVTVRASTATVAFSAFGEESS